MHVLSSRVAPEWVDYNGHMNDAEYARVFSLAVDALMAHIGLDEAGRSRLHYTLFTLETHLCYCREAHEGQALSVSVKLLDRDAKRLHVFFELQSEDQTLLATSEQMLMGIDQSSGRPGAFPGALEQAIGELTPLNRVDWPGRAGRTIGIRR